MSEIVTMRASKAYAKVNLSLEVVGRREDGYHELVSVMQTVSLADSVTIVPSESVELVLSGRSIGAGPNLAQRAAELLRLRFGVAQGCEIRLHKLIPVAAGLGGGSADAAATMLALLDVWHLWPDCLTLSSMAAELGSDVPFFLWGATALIEGRGERVTPVAGARSAWYLLVNPGFEVSTASVFAELDSTEWSDGAASRSLAKSNAVGHHIGVNGLSAALFRVAPGARECFDALSSVASEGAMVSGSGPTMFARFSTRAGAEDARRAVPGCETYVVSSHLKPAPRSPCVS